VCTYIISITLNYKYILCIEVAHINCLAGNLNIFASKTPVFSSSILFAYLSINKKLYYNSGLFLNGSIDLTSTGL